MNFNGSEFDNQFVRRHPGCLGMGFLDTHVRNQATPEKNLSFSSPTDLRLKLHSTIQISNICETQVILIASQPDHVVCLHYAGISRLTKMNGLRLGLVVLQVPSSILNRQINTFIGRHFLEWKCVNIDYTFLEIVPRSSNDNKPTLFQIMAWRIYALHGLNELRPQQLGRRLQENFFPNAFSWNIRFIVWFRFHLSWF